MFYVGCRCTQFVTIHISPKPSNAREHLVYAIRRSAQSTYRHIHQMEPTPAGSPRYTQNASAKRAPPSQISSPCRHATTLMPFAAAAATTAGRSQNMKLTPRWWWSRCGGGLAATTTTISVCVCVNMCTNEEHAVFRAILYPKQHKYTALAAQKIMPAI